MALYNYDDPASSYVNPAPRKLDTLADFDLKSKHKINRDVPFRYGRIGKRRIPLSPAYVKRIKAVARETGDNIGIIVTSAGQLTRYDQRSAHRQPKAKQTTLARALAKYSTQRTGSTRHDVHSLAGGETSDIKLTVGGKIVTPVSNPKVYSRFIKNAARAGFPGIGHYRWGLHVGGGTPAFWGPDTTSNSASPYFRRAYENGRKEAGLHVLDTKGLSGHSFRVLSNADRDAMIRTIAGEARGEGSTGQIAVASVIMNRVRSSRFPSTPRDVAYQPQQFSANNAGTGGNDIARKLAPSDPEYQQIGKLVDGVVSGDLKDPTGGATHYFAYSGANGISKPKWYESIKAQGNGHVIDIGHHRFLGKTDNRGVTAYGGVDRTPAYDVVQKPIPLGELTDRQRVAIADGAPVPTRDVKVPKTADVPQAPRTPRPARVKGNTDTILGPITSTPPPTNPTISSVSAALRGTGRAKASARVGIFDNLFNPTGG